MVDRSFNENPDIQIMEELNKFRISPSSFVKVFDLTARFLSRFPKSKKRSTEISAASGKLGQREPVPALIVSPGLCKTAWELLNGFTNYKLPLKITPENQLNDILSSNLKNYEGVLQTLDEGNVEQFVPRCFISDFDPQRMNSKAFSEIKYKFVGAASKEDKNIILMAEMIEELIVTDTVNDGILNILELQDEAIAESEPQEQEPQNDNYIVQENLDQKKDESNIQELSDEKPEVNTEPFEDVIEPEIVSEPQSDKPEPHPEANRLIVTELLQPEKEEYSKEITEELNHNDIKKNLRSHKKTEKTEMHTKLEDNSSDNNLQCESAPQASGNEDAKVTELQEASDKKDNEKYSSLYKDSISKENIEKKSILEAPAMHQSDFNTNQTNDHSKTDNKIEPKPISADNTNANLEAAEISNNQIKSDNIQDQDQVQSQAQAHNSLRASHESSETEIANNEINCSEKILNTNESGKKIEQVTLKAASNIQNENALKRINDPVSSEPKDEDKLSQLKAEHPAVYSPTNKFRCKPDYENDYSTILSVGVLVLAGLASYIVSK